MRWQPKVSSKILVTQMWVTYLASTSSGWFIDISHKVNLPGFESRPRKYPISFFSSQGVKSPDVCSIYWTSLRSLVFGFSYIKQRFHLRWLNIKESRFFCLDNLLSQPSKMKLVQTVTVSRKNGYIDVGDKSMLVTLSWWQFLNVSDRISILVTIFGNWCPTLLLKNRGCWWQKRSKPSPTSQSCHQHTSM